MEPTSQCSKPHVVTIWIHHLTSKSGSGSKIIGATPVRILISSVVAPDPEVFGPPGSRSVIICTDPDPYIIKQEK
jgi:hypothetical protein